MAPGNESDRRSFLIQSAAGVTAALAGARANGEEGATPSHRPNVLWLLGDQHRSQALSCMGDANVQTPNIDGLYRVSPVASAIAGCPLCTPFRGSMLTSLYPHQCTPGHDYAMADGLPTIAAPFNEAGYHTAYFGKWHVDGRDNRKADEKPGKQYVRPERRGGFETWLAYENNNAQYDCWLHGHDSKGNTVESFHLDKYETDSITDRLIGYIDERARATAGGDSKPFFAVMSVQPPHPPYVAPEEWISRHRPEDIQLRPNVPDVARITDEARRDLARYYAMIENLDWNVGRVVEALKKANVFENTYIVFFSDHGDMHGSHARNSKCVPWEESIRIPFIVSRGDTPIGAQSAVSPMRSLLNHVDIAPTTLGLCDIRVPAWMRGVDYSGYFAGRADAPAVPDSAFLQLVEPGYKYGFASDRERPWRGIVTQDGWKYAALEGQPWLLYNLNEDPYELANHALDGRYKAERRRLQERLARWISETGDTFKLPEIT